MSIAFAQTRRFTREEYYSLAEHGILKPDERTELIEGEIIPMIPPGPWHASSVKRNNRAFTDLFGEHAIVSIQDPLDLGELSQPEPDVAILRPRPDFYEQSHPTASDVIFLVEISDSSYLYDKNVKIGLYARAGVREVWLVHRERREITVYNRPENGDYRDVATYRAGERIRVPGLEGATVAVDDFGV